jgi:hypothetical protein
MRSPHEGKGRGVTPLPSRAWANRQMVEADGRMADANQQLLGEMRADSGLTRRRTSEEAA